MSEVGSDLLPYKCAGSEQMTLIRETCMRLDRKLWVRDMLEKEVTVQAVYLAYVNVHNVYM